LDAADSSRPRGAGDGDEACAKPAGCVGWATGDAVLLVGPAAGKDAIEAPASAALEAVVGAGAGGRGPVADGRWPVAGAVSVADGR
jgi:hypothetical protein